MLEEGFFDPLKPVQIRWGDLPHWRQDGALYFVTFRLGDSLPWRVVRHWRQDRDRWKRQHPSATHDETEEFSLRQRRRLEKWLDRGIGSCILRKPMVRSIVQNAIRHFEGERYELGAFTVAPNHVHILCDPQWASTSRRCCIRGSDTPPARFAS